MSRSPRPPWLADDRLLTAELAERFIEVALSGSRHRRSDMAPGISADAIRAQLRACGLRSSEELETWWGVANGLSAEATFDLSAISPLGLQILSVSDAVQATSRLAALDAGTGGDQLDRWIVETPHICVFAGSLSYFAVSDPTAGAGLPSGLVSLMLEDRMITQHRNATLGGALATQLLLVEHGLIKRTATGTSWIMDGAAFHGHGSPWEYLL